METTFEKIKRKAGRKETDCKCNTCRSMCKSPCLGTPQDIIKIAEAGYGDRLSATQWLAGILLGVTKQEVWMIQPWRDTTTGFCTFYKDGLCELHDKGLKPTEGRLVSHLNLKDNFRPANSLTWLVAKEWLAITEEEFKAIGELWNQETDQQV